MNFIKKLFRYYPKKTVRPSIKGVFIGMLYDFGLFWIIQTTLLVLFLKMPGDPVIDAANRKIIVLISIVGLIQFLLIEVTIWGLIYAFSQKKRSNT